MGIYQVFVYLQLLDLLTTLVGIRVGAAEASPFVRMMMHVGRSLAAGLEVMKQRVKARESGLLQEQYVDRVAKLNAILDDARLEDLTAINENRSLTDVAHEVLVRAGWISS